MHDREVYPNAPLRLVTAEFRFPLSPVLSSAELLTLLADTLGASLPIIEPAPGGLQLNLGPELTPSNLPGTGYRLLTRDRTSAVTVTPSRVAVETTSYKHWEDFRDALVRVALGVLGDDLHALAGLDRVGLRFINEIRLQKEPASVEDWHTYISSDLLAATRLVRRGNVKTIQTALHLEMGDRAELLMRSGILQGHVVGEEGGLRLPSPPKDGVFYLIDVDSFWNRPSVLDEWDLSTAIEISNRLHDPIDELFEACITDKLRNEILRGIS